MLAKWVLVVALCAAGSTVWAQNGPVRQSNRSAQLAPPTTQDSLYEIGQRLRASLRREATAEDDFLWVATVVQLTDQYVHICRDPRRRTSRTLESYRVKLRRRLLSIQQRLQRDISPDQIPTASPLDSSTWQFPALVAVMQRLALQQASQAGSGAASVGAGNQPGHLGLPRGGAARGDYGPALVALIQQTISPEFWDVHGGPGSIYYYRLWHALVVRATSEVHGQVERLTDRLR
jgi:hypothetical protein